MAYAASITVREVVSDTAVDGGRHADYVVTIAETEAGATSEASFALSGTDSTGAPYKLPSTGRVLAQIAILSAGTGTTIDPVLGEQTDPAAGAWRVENDAAAALVHNTSRGVCYTGIPTFYHRSVPNNAATDHTITTRYYIRAGWDG